MSKRKAKGKHIKIISESNIIDITNVDEYCCGHKYFYVRFLDSNEAGEKTISFLRGDIVEVIYDSNGHWRKANLKKQIIH